MDNLLNINMFDAVVIGLILLLSIKGLLSGFLKEFFNSLALIGGLFVASMYKSEVAQYAKEYLNLDLSKNLLELISLIVIFLVAFLVVKAIFKIIDSFLNEDISLISRLLGMIIKMFTLFFVFSLIVYGLSSKPQVTDKFKDTLNSSKLYPLLKDTGATILNMPVTNISSSDNNNTVNAVSANNNTDENKTTISDTVNNSENKKDDSTTVENNSTKESNSTETNTTK